MPVRKIKNLYIHIPFCMAKCRYCDFFSIPYSGEIAGRYLSALDRELHSCRNSLDTLDTIYIGGGTPSVLEGNEIHRLTEIVAKQVTMARDCEYTIEANPATLTGEKVGVLKDSGVNRVSIGVQSFDDRLLSLLGRAHNSREAEEAIRIVSDHFENFSIDLIYGIPGLDEKGWIKTLGRVLEFSPPHISAYELTPEKNTSLYDDLRSGRVQEVLEDVVVQMYDICSMTLKQRGYEHYEISNFARPGMGSRHNMNYWQRGRYLGIGPAAHSFGGNKRRSNVADVNRYCELLENGASPIEREHLVEGDEMIREKIFLGLRTKEGVDIGKIIEEDLTSAGETSVSMNKLAQALIPYNALGHVVVEEGIVRLTEKGFILSNPIIVVILESLGL